MTFMGKRPGVKDPVAFERLMNGYWEERKRLDALVPERTNITLESMKDPNLLEWCVQMAGEGLKLEEIRRRLGLGVASLDKRWAYIRNQILRFQLPGSEEEALLENYNEQEELVQRLETLIEKCQDEYKRVGSKEKPSILKEEVSLHAMLIEQKQKKFNQFMDVKKLRAMKKGGFGVQIVIQSNVPRPNRDTIDVTPEVKEIGTPDTEE